MFPSAIAALKQILTPPFRSVLAKCLGLTLAVLVLLWIGLDKAIVDYANVTSPWLSTLMSLATGLGLIFILAFLVAPVSSLIAGFFLDELAERVERETGGANTVGRALPTGQAIWLSARFACVSLLVNLCALLLLLVPVVNIIAFLTANAYLLGREYFELAALRYRPIDEVRALRRKHALYLFVCGFFIAAFVAIPVVNLLTPLFGVAFMVRVHRRIAPLPQLSAL
jgi:CysZ protein